MSGAGFCHMLVLGCGSSFSVAVTKVISSGLLCGYSCLDDDSTDADLPDLLCVLK